MSIFSRRQSEKMRRETEYKRKSIYSRKQMEERWKRERQRRQGQKRQLRLVGWVNWSMLYHILTYLILVFGIFTGLFLTQLYYSADLYLFRIENVMTEMMESEARFQMENIMNNTIVSCQTLFNL